MPTERRSTRKPVSRQPRKTDRISRSRAKGRLFRRLRLIAVLGGFCLSVFLVVYYTILWVPRLVDKAHMGTQHLQTKIGWTVHKLTVEGRQKIDPRVLKEVIQVQKGDVMTSLDLASLYDRVSKLAWVRSAIVQRHLPNTLSVKIVERTPRALFQYKGSFSLVDDGGVIIEPVEQKDYKTFIVLTGQGAPEKSPLLLGALKSYPLIEKRATGAMYISKRRWDLILDHQIHVKLPEDHLPEAFAQLNKLIQDGKILSSDIKILDLRQKDRIYFFQTDKALERTKAKSKAGPLKIT